MAMPKVVKNSGAMTNYVPIKDDDKEEEMTKSALAMFCAKEEEIEKRKKEVKDRVQAQLGRAEVATKRLAEIRQELEALTDPMGKDVTLIRKKVDNLNKELKSLGQNCMKKEREYREALETFNERNKEKAQLISKLMELANENEKKTMTKLEELSKHIAETKGF
ncbi:hypothetical protein ACFE04_012587 [Oxalis oulophora]